MANDTDKQQPCAEAVEAARKIDDEYELVPDNGAYCGAELVTARAGVLYGVAAIIQSAIDARLAEERKEVERIVRDLITVRATAAEVAETLLARWRKPVENKPK